MKKLIFVFSLLSIFTIKIFAQMEYVNYNNSVYNFLDRMETLHIIKNYNSFQIPKTRHEIASYLKVIMNHKSELDDVDKNILKDLEIEFEYDLYGSLNNSQSLLGKGNYNLFSQKQKYLFFYNKPKKFNLFINLVGEGEEIFNNSSSQNYNISSGLGVIGGEVRGTILNKFGFYLRGTNGVAFGNKQAAVLRRDISYNYKFKENPSESFFDETQGYLTADLNLVNFKIGRDRMELGYGPIKSVLGDQAPLFDYLAFNIKYSFFTFSYFHGQLLGVHNYQNDPVTGGIEVVEPKYFGYHRIGFNISRDLNFGAGEIIIYGNRPIDLSYLNPFSFYKSVEHANRDRDNSMLFFDYKNNSIRGLKLYGTMLIDDITFGKLGTGWWANLFMYNAGLYSTNLYKILPLGIRFEYMRISPYVFTHRILNNNFTNFGYPLASSLQPNSELFFTQINYRFNNRISLTASYSYALHGANPKNANGIVTRNVGGDINLGHRVTDSETTSFLDGDREILRKFNASLIYEPINQIFAKFSFGLVNNSLQNSVFQKQLETFFTVSASF